jgi:hypothetical protein
MAHTDVHRVHLEALPVGAEELAPSTCEGAMKHRDTIIPPPSSHPDEGFRMPYANEFILLSFEGHLKPFRPAPLKYGERPSYAPTAAPESPVSCIRPLKKRWWQLFG